MEKKVIITGSTGMVGKGVLLECLEDTRIISVLVVNRKSVGIEHPKLKEVLLQDFFKISDIGGSLKGYDACLFCLGVSSVGMKENDYRRNTYDLTMNFASVFLDQNPGSDFVYVSGAGTDSSEKGKQMWARAKGKTENDLLSLPFKNAYMFRPGFIEPRKGIRSRTPLYNVLLTVLRPLFLIFRLIPSIATSSIILGRAMIEVVIHGYEKRILESRDINLIGKPS